MTPDPGSPGFVPALPQAVLARRIAPPLPAPGQRRAAFSVPELDPAEPPPPTPEEEQAAALAAEAEAREAALAAARAEGHAAGEEAGRAAAAAAHAAERATAEAAALAAAAAALGRIEQEAGAAIDRATGALAGLLLAALDAALPEAAARLTPECAARLAGLLAPVLEQHGRIDLAVAPGLGAAVTARLGDARIAVTEDAALAPGDARARWRDGQAETELAERRRAIGAVLESLGLGPAAPAIGAEPVPAPGHEGAEA